MKFLLHNEQSDRLIFRKITLSDFDNWLEFFKDPTSFQHWNTVIENPSAECENWYKKQFHRYENDLGGMNALIEKETGRLIGHCGLLVQSVGDITELEIGYSLLSSGRNKGYATEAALKCMNVAFGNNYANSLISIISLTNTPSANVALKNGMNAEKQTIYHDNVVTIFRIDKTKWQHTNQPSNKSI